MKGQFGSSQGTNSAAPRPLNAPVFVVFFVVFFVFLPSATLIIPDQLLRRHASPSWA